MMLRRFSRIRLVNSDPLWLESYLWIQTHCVTIPQKQSRNLFNSKPKDICHTLCTHSSEWLYFAQLAVMDFWFLQLNRLRDGSLYNIDMDKMSTFKIRIFLLENSKHATTHYALSINMSIVGSGLFDKTTSTYFFP